MSRGDPPQAFESLLPYYRGARFAIAAFYSRAKADPELAQEMRRFIRNMDEYIEAVKATHRLRR